MGEKKEADPGLQCWIVENKQCVFHTGDDCIPYDACVAFGDPYCGGTGIKLFLSEQDCEDYLASKIKPPLECKWYETEHHGKCIFDRYWIFILILIAMAAELMGITWDKLM